MIWALYKRTHIGIRVPGACCTTVWQVCCVHVEYSRACNQSENIDIVGNSRVICENLCGADAGGTSLKKRWQTCRPGHLSAVAFTTHAEIILVCVHDAQNARMVHAVNKTGLSGLLCYNCEFLFVRNSTSLCLLKLVLAQSYDEDCFPPYDRVAVLCT